MIKILGEVITPNNIVSQYEPNSVGRKIIEMLHLSKKVYQYNSLNELKFEVDLRINIIKASRELNNSGIAFRVFEEAKCNEKYWVLTDEGGFLLKKDANPVEAIKDIFVNGRKYGTECATAIVIVYYKALADMLPENLFNELFPSIQLMDWKYLDEDMDLKHYAKLTDYLPGDCRYFDNPDVDPETPQWQGENAIDLGDGTYYGHGIGIKSAEGIIEVLNRRRKQGAKEEARLMDSATRPNFKYLADKFYSVVSAAFAQSYTTAWGYYSIYGASQYV
jgi:protein-glutamine gamma-glutamyltransferase